MSWIGVPNEVVLGFTGKPLRSQEMDNDLEYVFKPIKCPSCDFSNTNLQRWQDHRNEEHPLDEDTTVPLEPVLVAGLTW